MPVPGAEQRAADAEPDELRWRLVGAFRDGRYDDGAVLRLEDVARDLGVSTARLAPAVEFLRTIGHVRRIDDRSVVVTRPTFADWAEALRVMLGLLTLTVREALPTLDDDDRAAFRELVDQVRRQGALRDIGYTGSSFGVHVFFADRCPNTLLAGLARDVMSRLANALDPTPRFEQWETGGVLLRLADALDDRDAEAAVEAVLDLRPHVERHIAAVHAKMDR